MNKSLTSKMRTEVFLVGIGSTSGLFLHLLCRSSGKRSIDRLIQRRLSCLGSLLTVDRRSQILDLLLHTAVSRVILRRQNTVLILMGIHEILRGLPHLRSLLNHFIDSHRSIPPLNESLDKT